MIAMIAAGAMQVPVHDIAGVIAVRHCVMSAIAGVFVSRLVTFTFVIWCAFSFVGSIFGNRVLIDMITMHMMQMIIM
jgi:hypothetical protein